MHEEQPLKAKQGEHVLPQLDRKAFHCPHCGVLTSQKWNDLIHSGYGSQESRAKVVVCGNCHEDSYWVDCSPKDNPDEVWKMVYPSSGEAPLPHPDMPDKARKDYQEARSIVTQSPRGASALLRLAVEKLCQELEPDGDKLDEKIGNLVKKGLDPTVQQSLDALRVIGNNAVHPGELDIDDDTDTAQGLFECLNFIVEDRISRPTRIQELFEKLPAGAKAAIEKRDGKASRKDS